MRSSNPFLNNKSFRQTSVQTTDRMTLEGVANRTGMLLMVVLICAAATWIITWEEIRAVQTAIDTGAEPTAGLLSIGFLLIGGMGGFIIALIIWFTRPENPQILMFTYAVFEGMFLGAFSALAEMAVPYVSIQAIALTMGVFLTMLGIYKMDLIKPDRNFYIAITSMMGAIVLIYLISFILMMIPAMPNIPFIHGSGPIGIGFSCFVILIAALSFVMDFDFIENGVKHGAEKKYEWWAAFGLLITLIWLYVEIVRLLLKLAARR